MHRSFQRGLDTDPAEALFATQVLDVAVEDLLEPRRPLFRMRTGPGVWVCELHDTADDDGDRRLQ
jgi:hypothetical protein